MHARFPTACLVLAYAWLGWIAQPVVAAPLSYARLISDYGGPLAVADFDGDGRLDFAASAVTPVGGMTNAVFLNLGGFNFVRRGLPDLGFAFGGAFAADLDRDGDVDLLRSGWVNGYGYQTQVLRNDGGTLTLLGDPFPGEVGVCADLDQDGIPDLVLVNGGLNGARLWLGDGQGGFHQIEGDIGQGISAAGGVDFDNDGALDLLLRDYRRNSSQWFWNDGSGHFTATGVNLDLTTPGMGDWGDVDGDGRLDFVGTGTTSGGQLSPYVCLNRGVNPWLAATPVLSPLSGRRSVLGDFSQDGLAPDVFLASAARVFFRRDPESPGWNDALLTPQPGESIDDAVVADLDGDGDQDLLLGCVNADTGARHARIYSNTTTNRLVAPSIPENLAAQVGADSVRLAWTRGPGPAQPGLTFNLRVGTRPGAADVVNPSVAASGTRLTVGLGNTQAARQRAVRHLKPGTYYWTVQSIHPSGLASAFAAENSFVVTGIATNTPPSLSVVPHQTTLEDLPVFGLPFSVSDAETPAEGLEVGVSSSNAELVPFHAIEVLGTGSDRQLNLTPTPNLSGSTLIALTVVDRDGGTASTSFWLSVLPVNDPPTLSAVPSQTAYQGGPPVEVWFDYADPESTAPALRVQAISSDERLIPKSGLRLLLATTGEGSELTVTPAVGRVGSATVTIEVSDGELKAVRTFVVTVEPAPYLSEATGLTAYSDSVLAMGDFDNDGDLDLLVAGYSSSQTSAMSTRLYRNDGTGRFAHTGLSLPAMRSVQAGWVDFNRDGYLDLALTGLAGTQTVTKLLRNDAGTGFTEVALDLPGTTYGTIDWGDFDRDGLPDLLLAGAALGTDSRRLYRNVDGERFDAVSLPPFQGDARGARWADYDADGWLDFVVSGYSNLVEFVTLYHNEGPGGFREVPTSVALSTRFLGWADINSDGRPELWTQVATGVARDPIVAIHAFALDHTGLLVPALELPDLLGPGVWLDFDADGDLDCLSPGTAVYKRPWGQPYHLPLYQARLWRNGGGFRFADAGAVLGDTGYQQVVAADVDGDSRLDLLAIIGGIRALALDSTGADQTIVSLTAPIHLFRGAGSRINRLPDTPAALVAEIAGTGVRLSWSAPTDANQPGGLTYNVRVGTTPGGCDVLAPSAGPDGFVRLPGPGNAGGMTSLVLTNLVGETFFWSVQAVDASYAGSGFAAEQAFLVVQSNQPPELGELPNQVTPEETTLELEVPVADDHTPLDRIRLLAVTSDPVLVPAAGLSFRWDATRWLLRVTPASNQIGTATIRVVAQDAPGAQATNAFVLTVTEVNDAPTLSGVPDQDVVAGIATLPIAFEVTDVETPPERLSIAVSSDRPDVVPSDHIHLGGQGPQRTVSVQTVPGATGTVMMEIAVQDEAGATAVTRFALVLKPQVFAALPNPFATFRGDTAAWGDYDADGDLDVVIAGDAGPTLTRIYRNDGDGRFVDSGIRLANVRGGSARWGDLDNDGDLDLLLTGSYDAAGVLVYRNDGDGVFSQLPLTVPNRNWMDAEWGDLDNDGDLDFIAVGEGGNPNVYTPIVQLFLNQGQGEFIPTSPGLTPRDGPVAWTDFDRDGWLDLVLCGGSRGTADFAVEIWRNRLGQGFVSTTQQTAFERLPARWADLDGDGAPDLVLNRHSSTSTFFLRNEGTSTFVPWLESLPLTGSVAIGDSDNDGWPDLFVAGYGHDFMIGLTNGTHLFRSEQGTNFVIADLPWPPLQISGPAAWGDADGDHDLDLLVVGQLEPSNYFTQLYRNDLVASNTPPNSTRRPARGIRCGHGPPRLGAGRRPEPNRSSHLQRADRHQSRCGRCLGAYGAGEWRPIAPGRRKRRYRLLQTRHSPRAASHLLLECAGRGQLVRGVDLRPGGLLLPGLAAHLDGDRRPDRARRRITRACPVRDQRSRQPTGGSALEGCQLGSGNRRPREDHVQRYRNAPEPVPDAAT